MSTQTVETPKLKAKDLKGRLPPVWCPGCGDFGVLAAMQRALAARDITPENTVFISGIGCSSRFPHFMNAYGFHSCHGRALPTAIGALLANPDIASAADKRELLVVGGDGDGTAIGAGHFLHAARRNPDMTYVMMDNEIYGLTKGQASPTSLLGQKSKTTPYANEKASADMPLNPMALATLAGATFVARGYSGAMKELVELIGQAMDHDGYSFVQVISPCVTFNDIYEKARAEQKTLEATHDTSDKMAAIAAAMKDPYTTGVFYVEHRQTLHEAMQQVCEEAQAHKGKGLAEIAAKIRSAAGMPFTNY